MTLVELLLALSIAAIAFVGGLWLLEATRGSARQIVRLAAQTDRAQNARHLLLALTAAADPPRDTTERFIGSGGSATMTTWCPSSGGWLERCRIRLFLQGEGDSTLVMAELPTQGNVALVTLSGPGVLQYLSRGSRTSSFLTGWGQNMLLPNAVVVASATDTLTLPIGGQQ